MTQNTKFVIGGVGTHKAVHVAVVIDEKGAMLGTSQFATDRAGYRQLRNWMCGFGQLAKVGIEGTGSYGAGLARHLEGVGVQVIEVDRPNRRVRRRRGKSDTIDAEAAARSVLSGEATVTPKLSLRHRRVDPCPSRCPRFCTQRPRPSGEPDPRPDRDWSRSFAGPARQADDRAASGAMCPPASRR
jgi:hypothetical protein